jgi:hypothetical protein
MEIIFKETICEEAGGKEWQARQTSALYWRLGGDQKRRKNSNLNWNEFAR